MGSIQLLGHLSQQHIGPFALFTEFRLKLRQLYFFPLELLVFGFQLFILDLQLSL